MFKIPKRGIQNTNEQVQNTNIPIFGIMNLGILNVSILN